MLLLFATGVSSARGQEVWAPAIGFDGVNKTIGGVVSTIDNGPVLPTTPIYADWDSDFYGNGPFLYPNGFAENALTREWIVADTFHGRLLRFATDQHPTFSTARFIGAIPTSLTGETSSPYGPIVDDQGTILVADYEGQSIKAFVPDGTGGYVGHAITGYTDAVTNPESPATIPFTRPWGLAFSRDPVNGMRVQDGVGSVVVLDSDANRVIKLQPTGGAAAGTWPMQLAFGSSAADCACAGAGFFNYPTGLAIDAAGNIYVSDPYNATTVTIQVFDPTGEPLQIIAQGLSVPVGLTIAPDGRLFVTDSGNNRIAVYTAYDGGNPSGSLQPVLARIGTSSQPLGGLNLPNGPNPPGPVGELQEPTSVAFDQLGRLLVSDTTNARVVIFDRAHLSVAALAVPQTVAAAATSVDVRVTITLPAGEGAATNVVPSVPSVSFAEGGGPGSEVIDTTPSCIITPASVDALDCQPLAPLSLPVGGQLAYTFRFEKVPGAVGPVWFSVNATGLDADLNPIASANVQTYAVAIDDTPPAGAPAISAAFDPSNDPPVNTWFPTQPVIVNLTASMSDAADGVVQQIEYNFGPTPPDEGGYYVCFNVYLSLDPENPSCALSIYKGGTTTLWYRALSSLGKYDTVVDYGPDPTIQVPGWTSLEIKLDFTGPVFYLSAPSDTPQNGWFNQLPVTTNFSAEDSESLLDTVTVGASGGVATTWSLNVASGTPFANGSLTFSSEGVGEVTLTATDRAGHETVRTETVKIDKTAPEIGASPTISSATGLVTVGATQWSRSPVTVTFAATDDRSGFDEAGTLTTSCAATVATGVGQIAACPIQDRAGNSTAASAGPFSIDAAAPAVTVVPPPGGVLSGTTRWYASAPGDAEFTFNDGSGIGFAGGPTLTVSAPVGGTTATANATDLVGNTTEASAGPFVVDALPPTVTVAPAPPDATAGGTPWYRGPLEVQFAASDNGGSGFASPAGQTQQLQIVSNGEAVSASFTDLVGNTTTASAGPFNMDLDGPTVTVSYAYLDGTPVPGAEIGGATWFNAPIKVTFLATDAGVGFLHASVQLTSSKTFTVTTPAAITTTITDLLGNTTTATAGPFAFDTTPPAFTFSTAPAGVPVGSTLWYQASPATVTFVGDDGAGGSGFVNGLQTISVTVLVAGNQASTTLTDRVGNSTIASAGPFSVDADAPTVTVTADSPDASVGPIAWYGGPVSVNFLANDNGGAGFIDPATSLPAQTLQSSAVSGGEAVSATFTDLVGNTGAASAGPFNIDMAPPVIGAPAITFVDNSPAAGAAIGGVTWFKAAVNVQFTATDAGVGFSAAASQPTLTQGTVVNGAPEMVSHVFTDLLGNLATASAGPYGVDDMAPTLVVADIVASASPVTAIVNFTAVSATDNIDPSPAVSCSPASGTAFAFGVTNVTCTATDAVGNATTDSFTVTVEDTTAPVLTVPAAISQFAAAPASVSFAVSAVDNLDTDPAIVCTPPSGWVFPLGSTTVSCTATDASGNSSTKTFPVTLTSTPPTITVPASFSVEATSAAGAVATYTASAVDAVAGPVPVSCTPVSGSVFPLGPTTVVCTASNSVPLTSTATFQITVVDTTPPVLTAADITLVATSPAGAVATFAVTVQDLVDGATPPVVCTRPSGSTFPLGTTPVTCTATDSRGNTGSVTFDVEVAHSAPVCTAAAADPAQLWPPNHKFVAIGLDGVVNADGTPVTLTIASVYQDEPTSGLGDGDTPVDAQGVGTGVARVRAERSGTGNGRVYHISFNATSAGGSCSGAATVGVPHDQSQSSAIDDGPTYDSAKAAPQARNDAANAATARPVTIAVLRNDSDPLGLPLTIISATAPANGTAAVNLNGTITYTSAAGFTGSDTFIYTVSNGDGGVATASVTVRVRAR